MIRIKSIIQAPLEKVWYIYNEPEEIMQWHYASGDWQCLSAENDPRNGGRLRYMMGAKDGSASFDFSGVYDEVIAFERMEYTLDDGRKVMIAFSALDGLTLVEMHFESENTNPEDIQRAGWQMILDNFKKYTESQF